MNIYTPADVKEEITDDHRQRARDEYVPPEGVEDDPHAEMFFLEFLTFREWLRDRVKEEGADPEYHDQLYLQWGQCGPAQAAARIYNCIRQGFYY